MHVSDSIVRLGFEVGTGEPIDIPIAHMVVTGQTQLSGKTTTLEALISRADVRAMAFVTKRGEGSFAEDGNKIRPYFRERADWQFVGAILESVTREKMRFERAWIMKACRGAKTLADVRDNITKLQKKSTRSMDADIFMVLGEYLDLVVPMLARLPLSPRVDLEEGLNVVDLGDYPVELQGLVIGSMLSWVHQHENAVITILPESWKFIPQGRNSPVRMAATALAREGAALGNLLWIDSQDLAGAEKEIIRQASVYLLGVQREANEIKRTLAHIPAGIKKPKPEDIAQLQRGQFFACWGTHAVKTYVWPAWLSGAQAREIACGRLGAPPAPGKRRAQPPAPIFEALDPGPLLATARTVKMPYRWPTPSTENKTEEEDEMSKEDVAAILERLDRQAEANDRALKLLNNVFDKLRDGIMVKTDPIPPVPKLDKTSRAISKAAGVPVGPEPGTYELPERADEAVYQRFKARLLKEAPALVQLLVEKAEIQVAVDRKPVRIDGQTLRGRIGRLIVSGFFKEPQTSSSIVGELRRRGGGRSDSAHSPRELQWFTEAGFLTLEGDGHQAVPDERKRITILGE